MNGKAYLLYLGWTPAKLRERIQGCRQGMKEARDINPQTRWTYRFLYAELYRKYKRWLALLES